jgi:hypothetical protein
MAIQDVFACLAAQAVIAVLPTEDEVSAAVDAQHQATLDAGVVQGSHADQPAHHARAQGGDGAGPDPGKVVVQGVVVRDRFLARFGQAVDVRQGGGVRFAILEIQLAPAAEFADEQEDAVPEQEAFVVLDAVRAARVGDVVEP